MWVSILVIHANKETLCYNMDLLFPIIYPIYYCISNRINVYLSLCSLIGYTMFVLIHKNVQIRHVYDI